MITTILMSFLAGLTGANGVPHFVSGIVRRSYPNILGQSPVVNLLAGWAAFVIATILFLLAHPVYHPVEAGAAAGVGILLMGLFHALGGAFRLLNTPKEELRPREYMTRAWFEAIRTLMESVMASVDLSGITFTYSEEVRNTPRRNMLVGWHFVLNEGKFTVRPGPLTNASTSVVADYAVLRFLQRFELAGLPERREELSRLHKIFESQGTFHVEGENRMTALPVHVLEKMLPFHDRVAAVTA